MLYKVGTRLDHSSQILVMLFYLFLCAYFSEQVAPNGWSEGKCMGKAGWFPSAYVERQDKALVSKIETISSP